MQITKRDFLKKLGLGGAALATGAALGDEYVPDKSRLPEGSCGDPENVWFGKHIFPLDHTMTDVPASCRFSTRLTSLSSAEVLPVSRRRFRPRGQGQR